MSTSIPSDSSMASPLSILQEGWAQAYVEASVDAVVLIDVQAIVCYMNPASSNLFGYAPSECIGRNVSMLMAEPFRSAHDGYLARYLNEGGPRVIGIGREVEALHRDGRSIPVYLSVCEAVVDGKRMFVGNLHDMTEQVTANRDKDDALTALHARNMELTCLMAIGEAVRQIGAPSDVLKSIVEQVPAAYPAPGVASCRLRFDDEVYVSTGFAESSWCIRADITSAGRCRRNIEVCFKKGAKEQGPFRGDAVLLEAIARIAGEAIELREAEAQVIQASKLASIGELAAGVGHEINNPVNGIMNCADILLEHLPDSSEERQFADMIRSEADRIAKIVRNLLTFSRQDRATMEYVNIRDLIDVVLSLCMKHIQRSKIALTVSVPPDLPPIPCRSERVQQVLMNLILNAVHSLDSKYPQSNNSKRLAVSAETAMFDGTAHLRISVADRGIGIAPAHVERIFEPFFTTKGRDKGTGLGLSISHSIVREHGGALRVDSTQGIGATFHVYLPITHPGAKP